MLLLHGHQELHQGTLDHLLGQLLAAADDVVHDAGAAVLEVEVRVGEERLKNLDGADAAVEDLVAALLAVGGCDSQRPGARHPSLEVFVLAQQQQQLDTIVGT